VTGRPDPDTRTQAPPRAPVDERDGCCSICQPLIDLCPKRRRASRVARLSGCSLRDRRVDLGVAILALRRDFALFAAAPARVRAPRMPAFSVPNPRCTRRAPDHLFDTRTARASFRLHQSSAAREADPPGTLTITPSRTSFGVIVAPPYARLRRRLQLRLRRPSNCDRQLRRASSRR
jgi:hypothetical protein